MRGEELSSENKMRVREGVRTGKGIVEGDEIGKEKGKRS